MQFILLAGLVGIFFYALTQRGRSHWLANAMMAVAALGAVFVLLPEVTNNVARTLGVGRGADLVLYCFVLITFVSIFNIHLRLRSSAEITTVITRALAIASAQKPQQSPSTPPLQAKQ